MTLQQTVDEQDSDNGKVFIIDDEEDMVILFESYLDHKYEVETATSGPKALQKIDRSTDVVLLDRRMPEMSGDEVLGILREEGMDVQVAMLTGVKPSEDIVDLPFDDYMTKPVDEPDVVGLVDTLMTRKEYHKASQKFFRLVSKKAALEQVEKTSSDEYKQIVNELVELRNEIDDILDEITPNEVFDVTDGDGSPLS